MDAAAVDRDREDGLDRLNERLDPFMTWLGVLFALLVGFELVAELDEGTQRVLTIAGWAIWGAFALEFALELAAAPHKRRYLRRHWFQALALLVPTLRALRFVRLLRLGRALPAARVASASYRTFGTARRVARSRIAYIAALSSIVTLATAQLAYLFEHDAEDGIFDGFGDALLWAAAATFGQQAEPVPSTIGGRITMIAAFIVGVAVMGSIAATLGAWFVDERRERAETE